MTEGTFGGTDGTYSGTEGTYATVAARETFAFENFEWGGPLSERYEVKHYDGEITPEVHYTGTHGVKSGMDYFMMWGHPPNVYDERNRKPRGQHDYYPQKGDEIVSIMKLKNFNRNCVWVAYPLSFGHTYTYHWHRYTVNPVYRDRFRVVGWTRDGYDIVADSGKREVDWERWLGHWLAFAVKWYHPEIDGRTGVRAICFSADDFPLDEWSLEAYDSGQFPNLTAISDIDTADHWRDDKNKWFDNERRHRFGFGTTNNCSADFDSIVLYDRPR